MTLFTSRYHLIIYSRSWLHASMHFNVRSFWLLKLFKPFKTEDVIIYKQSIDLQSKSMDWFLYDNGLGLEMVKFIIGKKKIIGTCFKSGPIFRNFELYNNVINCAKLNYSTMEMFMLASFKHFKMRLFLDSQCKIWRKHHYFGLKD